MFDVFFELTNQHFRFLLDDFAFEITSTGASARDAGVVFRNRAVEVTVSYEMGSPPYVSIAALERRGDRIIAVNDIPLDLLTPDRLQSNLWVFHDLSKDELDGFLTELAKNLRQAGKEILAGDTTPLKPLRKKAEEIAARREAELFGKYAPGTE